MKARKVIIGLYLSIIALLVCTASMSVAWYTSGSFLEVQTVEVKLKNNPELLISTSSDIDSFKSDLTYQELKYTEAFRPVSSMLGNTWLDEKSEKPLFYQTLPIVPFHQIAPYGYYQQDLYLFTEDDAYVTFDINNCYVKNNERANRERAKQLVSENPELNEDEIFNELNQLINSLRISILVADEEFYSYTIYDPYKSGTTIYGGLLDNDDDGYYDYREDTNREVLFGDYEGEDKLVYTSDANHTIPSNHDVFNAATKQGIEHLDLDASINNGLKIKEEKSVSFNEVKNDVEKCLESVSYVDNLNYKIPVRGSKANKIVLSIYFEGWDLENLDPTRGASFNLMLSFMMLPGVVVL